MPPSATPSGRPPARGHSLEVVVALLWAVMLAGSTSCAKARERTEPPGPLVRTVTIDGAEAVTEDEIVEHLNLQPTSPVTLGSRSYYLPGLEDTDAEIVERVYESEGYYDATVSRFDVEVRREGERVAKQRAHVQIQVVEGEPTLVSEIGFRWIGDASSQPPHAEIERACVFRVGKTFSSGDLTQSALAMQDELASRGYAFAVVRESAQVDPTLRQSRVYFELEPRERKTISSIELRGLERIRPDLIMREVQRHVGKDYSPLRLAEIESAIYGTGVFSTVSVHAGPDEPGPDLVVYADVKEGKHQRVKLGVGLQIDPVRWQQHGIAEYQHHNLFERLYHFTARARAGYAELPALYQPQQHGPIADLGLELKKKGLLEPHLVWTEAVGIELGIWDGYQYYSVSNRLGVARFFTRFFELGFSYNNEFTDLFSISETLDTNRTVLGLDFRDPYFLAYAQLEPTLHFTDDLVAPTNGVRLSLPYDLASTYLGGQYDYQKIEPDLRAYYRPHSRIQLALRARMGMIFPYGRNRGAPIRRKFYLGGSNDMRGWPLRRLSPRVSRCSAQTVTCTDITVGGYSMVNGSFEARVRTFGSLWVAGFTDVGDVRERVAQLDAGGLMVSTGGGLRYDSPIGRFRLDFGWRLNDDARFPEPRQWAIHFGLGEAF